MRRGARRAERDESLGPSYSPYLDLVRPPSGMGCYGAVLCEIRRFEAPLCEGDVRFKILLHSQARSAVLHPALRKQRFKL